MTWIS